jgi:hypothetical protein
VILPAAREADELDAAAEKFRRAALVGRYMRLGMAQDRSPWWRQMRQRQRIRRRPRGYQKDRDLVLEELGKTPFQGRSPDVVAVGERTALIRPRERGEDFRRGARRVVAREIQRFLRMSWPDNNLFRAMPAKRAQQPNLELGKRLYPWLKFGKVSRTVLLTQLAARPKAGAVQEQCGRAPPDAEQERPRACSKATMAVQIQSGGSPS